MSLLPFSRERTGVTPVTGGLETNPNTQTPILEQNGKATIDSILGLGGMTVNITRFAPENPLDVRHEAEVVIAHGWHGPLSAYLPLAEALARRGVAASAFGDGRSFGWLGDFDPRNYRKIPEIESKVAWTATKAVERIVGDKKLFVGYGHSLGGQTVTNLATFQPNKFLGIIVDGSCGAENHGLEESIRRTGEIGAGEVREKAIELVANASRRLVPDVMHYFWRQPPRALLEGMNAGSTSLYHRWHNLGKLGIKKVAIQSAHDPYSPADAVERDSGDVLDAIKRRQGPKSGHLAPILDPEGTADIIVDIMDGWQAKPLSKAA